MDNASKTILVIDDSTTNVVLLEAVLMNKGYTIDKAMNVKEAYEVMQKKIAPLNFVGSFNAPYQWLRIFAATKIQSTIQRYPCYCCFGSYR